MLFTLHFVLFQMLFIKCITPFFQLICLLVLMLICNGWPGMSLIFIVRQLREFKCRLYSPVVPLDVVANVICVLHGWNEHFHITCMFLIFRRWHKWVTSRPTRFYSLSRPIILFSRRFPVGEFCVTLSVHFIICSIADHHSVHSTSFMLLRPISHWQAFKF